MNPESSYDMREKFVLENSDFIGYRMTFENNNLPDLIFEEGKFSAELFEKYTKGPPPQRAAAPKGRPTKGPPHQRAAAPIKPF